MCLADWAMSEIVRRRSAVVMTRGLTAGFIADCLGRRWLRRAVAGSGLGWLIALLGGVAGCFVLLGLLRDTVPAWTDGLGYLPFAVLLTGIALAVFASRPALTADGSGLRAGLRAYRRHLETSGTAEAYGRDLPYAVIFGPTRRTPSAAGEGEAVAAPGNRRRLVRIDADSNTPVWRLV